MGWNVTAAQMNLGETDARDFYVCNSTLEIDCRHHSSWSVLEIPGMNEWSGSSPSRL